MGPSGICRVALTLCPVVGTLEDNLRHNLILWLLCHKGENIHFRFSEKRHPQLVIFKVRNFMGFSIKRYFRSELLL